MGIWEAITDLVDAATPWSTAEAEAPAQEEQETTEQSAGSKDEEGEDEEEEEELEDPLEKFIEECKESKACAPAKHHYDDCVERVTSAQDEGKEAGEDCVEEFFHLVHCATQCAAPKAWSVLK